VAENDNRDAVAVAASNLVTGWAID
jgi:hypothetical protein